MVQINKTKTHDVQSVNIRASIAKVFGYIANPQNLPNWTSAFSKADENSAILITPNGELNIGLKTKTNQELGTIDWYMTMPDGSVSAAYSRVVAGPDGDTIYSFVLLAPPVPLEQIEGTLLSQMKTLKEELQNLKGILDNPDNSF